MRFRLNSYSFSLFSSMSSFSIVKLVMIQRRCDTPAGSEEF
jgi:hypothetical protein